VEPVDAIVARADALVSDIDLGSVKEWKAAAPSRKVVGQLPIYAPRELVHGLGMLPVCLFGGGDRLEIIRGDAYFQSYICHLPRSTVELLVTGRYDVVDGFLFPSICDVIRNLSGIWKMIAPEKYARYLDLPQNDDPEIGGRFWEMELRSLVEDLERLAGTKLSDASLRRSIALFNRNRELLDELYALRRETPWLAPSSELYVVVRAGAVLPVEEHNEMLRAYLDAARASGRPERDLARVAVIGAFCEQPPLGLLKTLERAGCYIVEDDLLLGLRWIRGRVREDGDPIRALVDAYLKASVASAAKYIGEDEKGRALVEAARRSHAEGVIFCAASFCDPALLDQPMLASALGRAGIQYTSFKFSEDTGQFAVIREQAGTFADSIKLWSEA
jgi:benzoyl-CoA reductase subunit C